MKTKEYIAERKRKKRAEKLELYIANCKNWKDKNPGQRSVHHWNDRLRNDNRGDEQIKWKDFSRSEQMRMNAIYTNRNERNQIAGKWEVDHIVSFEDGGRHHPDNLQVITKRENLRRYYENSNS
jgi:hypothetical protein